MRTPINLAEHGALVGLTDGVHALVPELSTIAWPQESAATCATCVMAAPHPHREVFLAETRCCTFFPRMVNHAVGRVLQRGGPGADAVRRLLHDGAQVKPLGIEPPEDWVAQYARVGPDGFGHTASLRCPYWVDGDLSCGVWQERNHVCRTWFCKHVEGEVGQALWNGTRDVLARAGRVLADALVAEGTPPVESASPEHWEAWFRDCADHAGGLDTDALGNDVTLRSLRTRLRALDAARQTPLPEVIGPALTRWEIQPEGGWVYGYSPYDEAAVPGDIWQLLSRLDGERSWSQAVAEAGAAGFHFGEDLVRELFRIAAVEPRKPGDSEPGLARVKLREADGRWRHMGMVAIEPGG